jgi:hypothetical protein
MRVYREVGSRPDDEAMEGDNEIFVKQKNAIPDF